MSFWNVIRNILRGDVETRYGICNNGHKYTNIGSIGGGMFYPATHCPKCGTVGGLVTTKEHWESWEEGATFREQNCVRDKERETQGLKNLQRMSKYGQRH